MIRRKAGSVHNASKDSQASIDELQSNARKARCSINSLAAANNARLLPK
jgi:hypothetical protein